MCSAILCEVRWSQDPEGSIMSSMESSSQNIIQDIKDGIDVRVNDIASDNCAVSTVGLKSPELFPPTPQYVTRQDSGVPEDLSSPSTKESPVIDDLDDTGNSDCNITVIHVSETLAESKDTKDGSDSGVEGCTAELARANGYSSSCNGLDEVSCDSSLVSCCSVYEDTCTTLPDDAAGTSCPGEPRTPPRTHVRANGEATSEGGSESSSLAGSISARAVWTTPKRPTNTLGSTSTSKKKIIKTEIPRGRTLAPGEPSHRLPSSTRTKTRTAAPRATPIKPQTATKDRAKSRDKSTARDNVESSKELNLKPWSTSGVNNKPTRTRSRPIPDSLTLSATSALAKELDKDLAQHGAGRGTSTVSRCPSSASRGRSTPGSTPSEESRRLLSTPRGSKTLTRSIHSDSKKLNDPKMTESKLVDAYATLPRRNKARMTICKSDESRKTTSRETSLNRIDKTRKRSNSRDNSVTKILPPYPKAKQTVIYHEISVQTGLTGRDIEDIMSGLPGRLVGPEIPDQVEHECQTEANFVPVETLTHAQDESKKLAAQLEILRQEKQQLEIKLSAHERLLVEERASHEFTRQELQKNTQRVLKILGTAAGDNSETNDSLLELESQFQESGQVVANQQLEIADLQALCSKLYRVVKQSLAAQKALIQNQHEVEAETMELQEFLQLEKTAMSEAMKDVEIDLKAKEEALVLRDIELERKMEECKHLVRISEQRRQENLSIEMKLNAVERRSRELLLTQGAAVSGAAVALSGLGSRLEGLVEQLIKSYKISEKDLEDVVYHNEAYSRSNSSAESSPISSRQHSLKDCTPSPKRNSFVSAVIGAIRNAATHPFVLRPACKKSGDPSKQQIFQELSMESSADLLDFETEPCLMMESVLEDVALPDTYTRNMVSSSDSLRRALSVPESIISDDTVTQLSRTNDECSSLNNLSQAILNRRRAEENEAEEEDDDDCESVSESEATGGHDVAVPTVDYCTAVNLVDQVIDVDNFVTKLLKVLRIIQLDNDTCIRELRDEKLDLEGRLAAGTSELNGLKMIAQLELEPSKDLKKENDAKE